jgi:hypothetical protein
MNLFPRLLTWLLALCCCGVALAQNSPRIVEGQAFAQRISLAGKDLQLNGTGVRAVAWFKGFAAGLYLSRPSSTMAQVLTTAGPKRLQLRMLHDVPADEFVKALRKGVERNTAAADMPALQLPLQRFGEQISALGKVRKGDRVDLDLDPARGLLFSVNGTLRGEPLPGDALYNGLLRAFLGDHPYDDNLKAGLLAGPGRSGPGA